MDAWVLKLGLPLGPASLVQYGGVATSNHLTANLPDPSSTRTPLCPPLTRTTVETPEQLGDEATCQQRDSVSAVSDSRPAPLSWWLMHTHSQVSSTCVPLSTLTRNVHKRYSLNSMCQLIMRASLEDLYQILDLDVGITLTDRIIPITWYSEKRKWISSQLPKQVKVINLPCTNCRNRFQWCLHGDFSSSYDPNIPVTPENCKVQ